MTTGRLRTTSIYTIILDDPAVISRLLKAFEGRITDRWASQTQSSVSFRAAGDDVALEVAFDGLEAAGLLQTPGILTTGLGVHRRVVGEQ